MEIISVIIPTWNRGRTIEEAINSALRQTYSLMEVMVCDDGSTDNTQDIIQRLMKVDSRIKWIPGAHGGRPAIPRNRGIRQSRGEWLAFLDSDDEWLPQKLEKQLALAKKLDLKAACSNARKLLPDHGIAAGNVLESKGADAVITFDDLLKTNEVICSSALIHRSVFTAVEGFPQEKELKALEDYALWLRISTQTDFAYLAEPALVYRDDPKNSVRSDDINVWAQRRRVYKDFLQWAKGQQLKSDHNYFKTKARKFYLKSFIEQTLISAIELRKSIRQI